MAAKVPLDYEAQAEEDTNCGTLCWVTQDGSDANKRWTGECVRQEDQYAGEVISPTLTLHPD